MKGEQARMRELAEEALQRNTNSDARRAAEQRHTSREAKRLEEERELKRLRPLHIWRS